MHLAALVGMRIGAKLGIAGAFATTFIARAALGEALTLREVPGNITEGTVIINAPPDEVYEHATNFAHWTQVFSDIRESHWESGDREHARIRFKSKSFDLSVTVLFDNEPGHVIRFKSVKAPPGARAWGEYTLRPIDGGRRTAVVARLYMNVVGPGRLLVSGDTIESMRRLKLTLDLGDTERRFAQR